MSEMERTLAIIKPDAVAEGHAGEILTMIERAGFRVLAMRMVHLTRPQAEGFYEVHRGRPFFEGLVNFMMEGPVIVLALEAEDVISRWRELIGTTDPAKAAEGTVRARFGSTMQHNAAHGSDSPENAALELSWFFNNSELELSSQQARGQGS